MLDGAVIGPAPSAPDVILVIEDEWPNRALFKATVARAAVDRVRDAVLLEATTLAEARAVLDARTIDLIVLDVRLPDGDGLSLAHDLNDARERPRILVLSASVLPSERALALDAGTDGFMAKPFVPATLVDTIARLLELGPVAKAATRP